MEKLKITFLGTGDAIPTKTRNHTSILVEFKEEHLLIDCGEGTQRQFKYAQLSPHKIDRLLITHWHGDHILGIPGLLQTLAMSDYSKIFHIYGPKGTKYYIDLMQKLYKDFKLNIQVHEVSGKFIDEKDFYIEAKEMSHGTPTLAYSLVLKDKIRLDKNKLKKLKLPNSPILKDLQNGKDITFNGKKIKASDVSYKEEGKKVTIILDTGINKSAEVLAKNSTLLIAESTYLPEEEKIAREYKHLTLKDAVSIAKKSKSKQLILTHVSQRYEGILEEVEKKAKKLFKNSSLARDLSVFEI